MPTPTLKCSECFSELPYEHMGEIDGKYICIDCRDNMEDDMPDLNIEAGKFYKTRDGRKARIYEVYPGLEPLYSIHGAIYDGCTWYLQGWTRTGGGNINYNSERDLISPWIDPPVVDWDKFPKHIVAVAMESTGLWNGYIEVPEILNGSCHWSHKPNYPACYATVNIHRTNYPDFTGDWRDSLAIRPGYEEEK